MILACTKPPAFLGEYEVGLRSCTLDVPNMAKTVLPDDPAAGWPDWLGSLESPCKYDIRATNLLLEGNFAAQRGERDDLHDRKEDYRRTVAKKPAQIHPRFDPFAIANPTAIPIAAPIPTPTGMLCIATPIPVPIAIPIATQNPG